MLPETQPAHTIDEWSPTPRPAGPTTPADGESGPRLHSSPVETQGPRVLLATQQAQVRAIGTTILQAAGFRVETETNGETIIADLETLQPDAILTDLSLGDMQAAHLCVRIRELPAGQTIPILVIADHLQADVIQKILAIEFTDLVAAPVNWKIITFRIHRWISMTRKFRALSDHELDLEQVRDSALKASTELLQLRNYDSVTGLPNREMFLSTTSLLLSQNQSSAGYLAVLYLDIDEFKAVNDLIGRELGDELLRIVAKRLQGSLRDGDLLSQGSRECTLASFARMNGDQFAILLSSIQDRKGAAAVANRLLSSLSRPLAIRDRRFRLAARIGIADSSLLDGDDEETLVQQAETAMRYCKHRIGKTYAFFEDFMDELVRRKLEIKGELRQAIDREQLFLCYQFLVDSETAIPTGVEGLIRWRHPSRGEVPPNEFMPVAEASELVLEIDRWVLRTGCRQGKQWLENDYPPLLMSLNVSTRFLEQDDFAEQVLAIVDETGLPPSMLQLELSERGSLPEAERIMPQFERLVDRGVHLALDDFGTGQTSLSYLRTLPISCVKVDRAFVRGIPNDSASMAIVTAIVAMSNHLGLKIVAEGVETEAQWHFLAEQKYDQLQGFLFSAPECPATLENTVRRCGEWQMPAAASSLPVDSPAENAPSELLQERRDRRTADAGSMANDAGESNPGATEVSGTHLLPQVDLASGSDLTDDQWFERLANPGRSDGQSDAHPPVESASVELRKRYSHAASVGPTGRGAGARRFGAGLGVAAVVAGALAFWPAGGGPQTAAEGPPSTEVREMPEKTPPVAVEPAAAQGLESAGAAAESRLPGLAEPPAEEASQGSLVAIADFAEAWARAWSEQRVDDYLRFYAGDFRPVHGMSRGDWETLRRQRILAPRRIEVELDVIEARLSGAERATVSFQQSYRSDGYRDTVRKTLELIREGGDWKILAERVVG